MIGQGFTHCLFKKFAEFPSDVQHAYIRASIGMIVRRGDHSCLPSWNFVYRRGRLEEGVRLHGKGPWQSI